MSGQELKELLAKFGQKSIKKGQKTALASLAKKTQKKQQPTFSFQRRLLFFI